MLEPWHWKPNRDEFTLEAVKDGVKRILRVTRPAYDDRTTVASNRLVKNGNAMMLPHRHSKSYVFVNRLLGRDYKNYRKCLHEMRYSVVVFRKPRENWKHPDGIIRKTRSASGGISSTSFQETSDARHVVNITYQIVKDSTDVEIVAG